MNHDDLKTLLRRLASGTAREGDLERARALVEGDGRFPRTLVEAVFRDDVAGDAEALLAVLEGPLLPGGAAETFPDDVEIADAVIGAVGGDAAIPIAEAVRAEAGHGPEVAVSDGWAWIADALRNGLGAEARRVDVAEAVIGAVGGDAAIPVAEAVRAEAGTVDVAGAVARATDPAWLSALLDGEHPPEVHRLAAARLRRDAAGAGRRMTAFATLGSRLREAVSEEAGPVDLWPAVARAVGLADPEEVPGWDGRAFAEAVRAEAGPVQVVDGVMARVRRAAVAPGPGALPEAANDSGHRWWLRAVVVVAAAILVAVLVYRPGSGPSGEPQRLQFASAGEVTIENLSYADDVMVQLIQAEGDAPLILWVEEEVTL